MAIHDHIRPGLDARVMAKIVTVDPAQRKIEAALKDGGLIHIAVFDSPSVFVWPQQGEHWTVRKDSGIWRLDKRVDSNDEHKIDNINPGEAKIYADTITNMSGHQIPAVDTTNNDLVENAALVYQGNSWVPITGPQFESITVKKDDDHYVEIKSTADIHVLNGAITMKADDSNFINARATGDLSLLNGSVLISGSETVAYTPKIIDKIESNTPVNDPPKYVTYTCYGHGLSAGQVVSILDADVAGFNGSFVIVAVTDSTFQVANRTVGDSSSARIVYATDSYTQISTSKLSTTAIEADTLRIGSSTQSLGSGDGVITDTLYVKNDLNVSSKVSSNNVTANTIQTGTPTHPSTLSAGDIAASNDLWVNNDVHVYGGSTFYGDVTVSGSTSDITVGGDVYIGSGGHIYYNNGTPTGDLFTTKSYVDTLIDYSTSGTSNEWKVMTFRDQNTGHAMIYYEQTYALPGTVNLNGQEQAQTTVTVPSGLSTTSVRWFLNYSFGNFNTNGLSGRLLPSLEIASSTALYIYVTNLLTNPADSITFTGSWKVWGIKFF